VDSYPSAEEAAEAAMDEIYHLSNVTNSEMGGYVLENIDESGNKSYSYTEPDFGKTGTCEMEMPEKPDNAVAIYHSHPNVCAKEFSKEDLKFKKKKKLREMYVINPSGQMLRYPPCN
jgi:proteasome lid subunit RPN8/RPN11